MKMLQDNVLLAEVAKEETTSGGIIISGAQMSKGSQPGLVLAVGPDVLDIEQGDRVFLDWSKSLPVDHDMKQAVIVSSEHIKAVI
jgi:co-chaperonin GroES (HSP10)